MDLSGIETTTTFLLLHYSTFFAFGGSNAISSVDLSNAYNGVNSYNILAVGILTFVSNWAGPIWWVSAARLLFQERWRRRRDAKGSGSDDRTNHIALLTLFVSTSLLAVMVACSMLRTHLFIWTVFSPKFLFSMAWSLADHLVVNVAFGSLISWVDSM